MSTPELDALLEQAIAHVNAGEMEQGRALLERVLEQNPRNARAWVWLSGCVEEPMQRRICLQQALSANPNNQAALDGMKVLEGELVPASAAPPSLLESRLSPIDMEDTVTAMRASEISPPEAMAAAPVAPVPIEVAEEQEVDETGPKPQRRRIVLVVAVVLILLLCVCGLVVTQVVPQLLDVLEVPVF